MHAKDRGESVRLVGTRRSRKPYFILLAFAASAIAFIALDLLIGSVLPATSQQSFRTSHAYYHHALRPQQSRVTKWGERSYSMTTNSLGFRDQTPRIVPLESQHHRLLMIGDSMIEGLGVEFDASVAGLLSHRWRDRDMEVMNAGVVSYSPHLYHLKIKFLLEQIGLKFDELLVFIDISDIQDELHYKSFQETSAIMSEEDPLHNWWFRNSVLARTVTRLGSHKHHVNNEFRTDADVNIWMETMDAYSDPHIDPEVGRWHWTVSDAIFEEWGRQGLQLAEEQMEHLVGLCDDHSIEVTLVVYPAPVQIFANDRDSRQVKFWKEFCDRLNIAFVDLFPAFINDEFQGPAEVYQTYFQNSDVHWNEAGNKLVADSVGEHFESIRTSE